MHLLLNTYKFEKDCIFTKLSKELVGATKTLVSANGEKLSRENDLRLKRQQHYYFKLEAEKFISSKFFLHSLPDLFCPVIFVSLKNHFAVFLAGQCSKLEEILPNKHFPLDNVLPALVTKWNH